MDGQNRSTDKVDGQNRSTDKVDGQSMECVNSRGCTPLAAYLCQHRLVAKSSGRGKTVGGLSSSHHFSIKPQL
jgi:hypothetical protein